MLSRRGKHAHGRLSAFSLRVIMLARARACHPFHTWIVPAMFSDQIEKMKREYTDKYVVVDAARPELARFRDIVGRVKTVNMSGRAARRVRRLPPQHRLVRHRPGVPEGRRQAAAEAGEGRSQESRSEGRSCRQGEAGREGCPGRQCREGWQTVRRRYAGSRSRRWCCKSRPTRRRAPAKAKSEAAPAGETGRAQSRSLEDERGRYAGRRPRRWRTRLPLRQLPKAAASTR